MTTAIDNVRKECAGCGSDRIQMLSHTETCMACLERGVGLWGLRDQVRYLADRLAYAGITDQEGEGHRADLIEAVNRMVLVSREIERVRERVKSLGV